MVPHSECSRSLETSGTGNNCQNWGILNYPVASPIEYLISKARTGSPNQRACNDRVHRVIRVGPRDTALVDTLGCASCLRSYSMPCLFPCIAEGQHPSYGDCLEVKREYYQNCSVLDCVTQCSQSAAHLYEQFLQVQQIGFVSLGPLHCAYGVVLL